MKRRNIFASISAAAVACVFSGESSRKSDLTLEEMHNIDDKLYFETLNRIYAKTGRSRALIRNYIRSFLASKNDMSWVWTNLEKLRKNDSIINCNLMILKGIGYEVVI
jgi:hypothetical protein